MKQAYDVAVIGCGGFGSAAAYWLAKRAKTDVLAIEQFALGHDRGSSQDHSRIIRRSYHDPIYTRLTAAAYDTWEEVEAEAAVQDDVGGCAPSPRKLGAVSLRIAKANLSAIRTSTGPSVLRRICLKMMQVELQPIARAART